MNPVRVGFVIDFLRPGGGTENQLLLLLGSFDRRRLAPSACHFSSIHGPAGINDDTSLDTLGITQISPLGAMRATWGVRRWVRSRRLELVVTFFRDANVVGTLGARWAGVPVVSSRRNLGHWHTPRELRTLRVLNRMTRAFVANSEAIRAHTVRVEDIPVERIEVIPNAIDLLRFRPRAPEYRAQQRSRLGLPDGLLIVCVANLRPVKALDVLLRAFGGSDSLRRDGRLILVGSGSEEQVLRAQASALGIGERVHFLGSRPDVAEILPAMDVAVLCSHAESSPNSVLEYMATALPVAATDVGGSRELLADGHAGVLVPPGRSEELRAALESLASSSEVRARLGQEARRRAEALHGLDRVVEHWTSFLERMARPPAPEA